MEQIPNANYLHSASGANAISRKRVSDYVYQAATVAAALLLLLTTTI
jgi:hypothetical protein